MEPWPLFVLSYLLSAVAGLTYSLRKKGTMIGAVQAFAWSGFLGMGITMGFWWKLGDSEQGIYALLAVAFILPAMGVTVIDFKPLFVGFVKRLRRALENSNGAPRNGEGKFVDRVSNPDSDS